MSDYQNYLSPFSWRYASPEMRTIWSETHKRLIWRKLWVCLARVEMEFGLVQPDQVADLEAHAQQIDMETALKIEAEIQHDLMAELKTFAGQCPTGGGIIHLGATSMDIEDNADALRLREALRLLNQKLAGLLAVFAERIEETADLPVMAFTHLQPAEPTTLGYRLALYGQDLLEDYTTLQNIEREIRGKGFKGAVGTAASYADLLGGDHLETFEGRLSALLELPFYPVTGQTYPRKQEYALLAALAGLGQSVYKFAFDLRLLQSPPLGELAEPFGAKQVGSSAMPFKRNPINAEKIDSLARSLSVMPQVAWGNAAHSLLERTLDDSANRRTLLPEAFLISDELLKTATRILKDLRINRETIARNLAAYAPFAATERVLMAMGKAGADRQATHERLRQHALAAWTAVQQGQPNPLAGLIGSDPFFNEELSTTELQGLFDVQGYVGLAPRHARELAARLRSL
jgi:adenylosuccinate lyase